MARACEVCGRKRMVENNVSHANNKTKRIFAINLQTVRAKINGAGHYLAKKASSPVRYAITNSREEEEDSVILQQTHRNRSQLLPTRFSG